MYNENEHTLGPVEYERTTGQEIVKRRGDAFDIGEITGSTSERDMIIKIMENPQRLAEMLGLDEKQAENIRATLTGAGAGLSSKFLSQFFGEEISGAVGGFLGGYIARRIIGK